MAFPDDYIRLGKYTLPTISGSVTNFPLLLRFADFTSEMLSQIEDGGGDLRISADEIGSNQIPIDIQAFDKIGEDVIVWALIPTATTGAEIHIWGGNPGDSQPVPSDTYGSQNVWQDFDLVIHQGTSSDATGVHSVSLIGSPSLTNMLWGGQGYNMTLVGQYIRVTHASTLNIQKNYSIDVWVNTTDDAGTNVLCEKSNGNTSGFRFFEQSGGNTRSRHPNLSPANLDASTFTFGLQRMSSNMDGTTRRNWLNGSIEVSDTPTGTVTNNTADMYVGTFDDVSNTLGGVLGEFWLSSLSNRGANRDAEQSNQTSTPPWGTPSNAETPVTASASFDIDKPLFSASASATLPNPDASVSFTLGDPEFSVNASASLPEPASSVDFSIASPEFSANASATSPNPTVSGSFNVGKPSFSVSASATLPAPDASISYEIDKPLFSGSASATLPNPSASSAFTVSRPTFSANASATLSGNVASIGFSLPEVEFSSIAEASLPNPSASASFDMPSIQFSAFARIVGGDVYYDNDAIIKVSAAKNIIVVSAGSNIIKR